MEILKKISENKNLALALGYFDGVHLGHKKIISELIKCSKENNTKSAIITFQDNPANYFKNSENQIVKNIQNFKDKEIILDELGVDYLYELNFEDYKELSAHEYLEILIKYFKPKAIVVGYNHTFGFNRSGSATFLKENAQKYGYKIIVVPQLRLDDLSEISSTSIRNKIKNGDLEGAKALLGRNFTIRNSVIKGDGVARKLGYPTANLIWSDNIIKLPYGVYFGYVEVDFKNSKTCPALISWGCKPTLTSGEEEILEAHIYNFNENIYGKIIKVGFIKKLRNQETFQNFNQLQIQLRKDYKEFEAWAIKRQQDNKALSQ